MEASTLIDPRVAEEATTVVPIVAHGPLEHGTYEAEEGGRKVTRCRLYRNLECADHQGTHDALKPYQPAGRFRIPFTVWIDPEGNKLFRRDGWRRPDEFLLDIRLALEKVPGPRRSKAEYAAIVKPLDEAAAAMAADRFGEAASKFEEALGPDVAESRRIAQAGLDEIRHRGETLLAGAQASLKAGSLKKARPALELLAGEFRKFDSGREAAELLKSFPRP